MVVSFSYNDEKEVHESFGLGEDFTNNIFKRFLDALKWHDKYFEIDNI